MASKANSICGMEIGKETLSIVQYSPETNAVVGIAIKPLNHAVHGWWESVRAEFKSVAATMKLGGVATVCSIPAEHAIIKRLIIDKEEANPYDTLRWELEQQLIGSMDEYVFDYQKAVVSKAEEFSTYLVAACRAAALERVSTLMKMHRLSPVAVDLDIFAMVNVFEANYRESLSKPALLVLGGEEYTKVALTCDGDLVDYELLSHASTAIEPADYASLLVRSVHKLVALNVAWLGKQMPKAYLAGPLFSQEQFSAPCLSGLPGAEPLLPFRAVSCRALTENDLQRYAPQLAVAVGLALRANPERAS